jgi:hypothetical protein
MKRLFTIMAVCCSAVVSSFAAPVQCTGSSIAVFNKDLDHLSLHYDFSNDGDDLMSAGADRAVLETIYGTAFLATNVSRVGGTYGTVNKYYSGSESVQSKLWGDVGGQLLAKGGSAQSAPAADAEFKLFRAVIERGGRVFVKEGGAGDFSMMVVKLLENWQSDSGKCVYITHHSYTNDKHYGAGVLSYLKAKTVYRKISDGNTALRKAKWRLNGRDFAHYARSSRLECGWNAIFAEFKKQKTYCKGYIGKRVDQSKCVNFSDTHELLWNIQLDTPSKSVTINEFVQK